MKQGLFHFKKAHFSWSTFNSVAFVVALIITTLPCHADDLDDFLNDAPLSPESVIIDLENEVGADFDVIDELSTREKSFNESLRIEPKYKKPRVIGRPETFTAQLKKGSILFDVKDGKAYTIDKPIVVTAQLVLLGGNRVFILDKNGKERYQTQAMNAVNIESTVRLNPDINPITVYSDRPVFGSNDSELKFSHFISYSVEAIRTDYFATIFRGERQSANSNILQAKNYFMTDRFPIQVGFNISGQFGFWEDPTLGTMTWSGVFAGPSFMRTFWQKDDSRWNMHVSAFTSLFHESEKAPDRHRYSTLGLQTEIEKEFDTSYGPIILGLSYRWSRSSIKETTEYLENEALKGQVIGFGAYLSYRFNWSDH